MGIKSNLCFKTQILLSLSFLLFLPSVSSAQDGVCVIAPLGTNWNCPFSTINNEGRSKYGALKLDNILASAQTEEQVFLALKSTYQQMGGLNDFVEWLRTQGFYVSASVVRNLKETEDQVGSIDIVFDAAEWELFDSFLSALLRFFGAKHTPRGIILMLDASGRPTKLGVAILK